MRFSTMIKLDSFVRSAAMLVAMLCTTMPIGSASAAPMGGGADSPPIENQLVIRPAPGHTLEEVIDALVGAGFVNVAPIDSIPGHDTHLLTHDPQPGVGIPQMEAMLVTVTNTVSVRELTG